MAYMQTKKRTIKIASVSLIQREWESVVVKDASLGLFANDDCIIADSIVLG